MEDSSDKTKFCKFNYISKNRIPDNNNWSKSDSDKNSAGPSRKYYYNPYEIPVMYTDWHTLDKTAVSYYNAPSYGWANYISDRTDYNNNQAGSRDGQLNTSMKSNNTFTTLNQYPRIKLNNYWFYPDSNLLPCDLSEGYTYIIANANCPTIRFGGSFMIVKLIKLIHIILNLKAMHLYG